ncbi:AAA family ATPase [Shewanella sp. SM23]|uniref:AAA family ATPase n=1 Tax=Shewanella sp. SM23 TaxID=2912794 RepID=UPI0021DB4F41|nr:AAA family ATPase [Shewanella sp. SM23]MCU8082259.1 AAA family ATPase [Shewanella sp. SM23]
MESIKIEGLRSLKNSGFVDIKPLTLLLGENSSGKSTFLRTFPLLRQSTESHTRGPILWYGSYVDFGSFDDALSNYSDDKSISFSFKIKSKSILSVTPKRVTSKAGILSGDIEATLKVVNDGRNGQTRVRSVQIKHNENEIEIIYGKGDKLISVISNGINLTDYFGSVIVAQEKSRFSLFTHIKFPSGSSTYAGFNDYDNPNLKELINNCVAEYAHGKSNLADLTQRMLRQQTMSLSDFVEKFSGISPTHTWKKKDIIFTSGIQ